MAFTVIRAPLRTKGTIIRFSNPGAAPAQTSSVDVARSVDEPSEFPLRVAFFSGIVTVEGITRSYPGGLAAFDSDFPNAHFNATLRLASYMSVMIWRSLSRGGNRVACGWARALPSER